MIALLSAKDPAYVHEAAKRGVFAYIIDGSPEELQSAIDITLQRFAEYHSLQGAFGRRATIEQAPMLPGGHLNAIDLATRTVLWSFSRPTAEANWSFGHVLPVDGGLWVDSYQALVKLE